MTISPWVAILVIIDGFNLEDKIADRQEFQMQLLIYYTTYSEIFHVQVFLEKFLFVSNRN